MVLRRFRGPVIGLLLAVALVAVAGCGSSSSEKNTDKGSAATTAPQAPAAAQQSAAPAQNVAKTLILYGDTVRGGGGLAPEEQAYLSCVQQNRYPQGGEIVWRFRVVDPVSAKPLDDKALKSVTLTLPDGKTQDLKYGAHPKGKTDDYFWTTSFKVGDDYPTGAFTYKLEAVDLEGRTGSYTQFNVASAILQIVPKGQR